MIRRSLMAVLLALMLLLSGCFTTALWGGGIEASEEVDFETGRVETEYGPTMDFSNVRSWSDLGACILLTPFTLALDIVTSPIQAFLFGWDDEDDDC